MSNPCIYITIIFFKIWVFISAF